MQFVLHAGSIVNNCVTDNANLPVSAAMAKSLQDQINQANSNLTSKIIKTYYSNLTTDSDGLCNIQAKSGYTPIFAWVIYPTSSMQTYARIQYNPYSGQFFAKTPLISSGIELNVIYVKLELTH